MNYLKSKLQEIMNNFDAMDDWEFRIWFSNAKQSLLEDPELKEFTEEIEIPEKEESFKPTVFMFTDGGCAPNPGKGGYGVIIQNEAGTELASYFEGYEHTTNNRMETMALLKGLSLLGVAGKQRILVTTDSQYVILMAKKFMNATSVPFSTKNRDLWQRFIATKGEHELSFEWVKGHSDHPENERCDQMSTEARSRKSLLKDAGFIG